MSTSNSGRSAGQSEAVALAALAVEPAGARFRLADLQLHTPADKRFKPGMAISTARERTAFSARYVEAAQSKGLEVVAITEHNDVSWTESLREAAANTSLLLFPGFEVASTEGVHVVCLFEPGSEVNQLEETLVSLGLGSAKRFHADGSPRVSDHALIDLVEKIQNSGGLCMLAHVDGQDGILTRMDGEPRVKAWTGCGALVVQCSQDPLDMPAGFNRRLLLNETDLDLYRRARPYACIQTSDARDLSEIGSKPSYVKMSSDSLDGLKQAFLDPGSRVRFPGRHHERPVPRLLAARWDGAFLDEGLPLNSNLNCLVGGKGTGKSTVIETIRHVFGLPIATPDVRDQAQKLLNETFPTSAKLSLLIEVPTPKPTRYVVQRIGRDDPVVRNAVSGELIPGLRPNELMRPLVFGQKEIYETAQRIETQLKLLDTYCAEELRLLLEAERNELEAIAGLGERIRALSNQVDGIQARLAELPLLRERKRVFDEAGLAVALGDQTRLQSERGFWAAAEERFTQLELAITALRTAPAAARVIPETSGLPNEAILDKARKVVTDLDAAFKETAKALAERLEEARRSIQGIRGDWEPAFATRAEELRDAVRPLEDQYGAQAVREYLQLGPRIDGLAADEGQVERLGLSVAEFQKQRAEHLAQLREERRAIFRVRESQAAKLSAGLEGTVRVSVEHQGDRRDVLRALKDWKTGANQAQLEQMIGRADFSVTRLADLLRKGHDDLAREFGLTSSVAQRLTSAATDERIDNLEVLALGDRVEVALNVAAGGPADYRPLDRLSAGQRSTAILLLALLQGNEPLLLDQPEDDLDNRFIYTDVVRRLREAKEERQFIIATHNANIPVLGDAEHIVILDATSVQGQVHARVSVRGSIDDESMRGPLEDVLEGGREAFQLRRDKYGF